MQTLGLSDSEARTEGRLKRLLWPSIQTGADVDYLGVQGYWVCTVIAVLSFIYSAVSGNPIIGALLLLFFYLGGVGVRERARYAASVVLILYGLDALLSGLGVIKLILGAPHDRANQPHPDSAHFACAVLLQGTAEWTKILEDGATQTVQNHRLVVRDGAGRIFQERRRLVPKDSPPDLQRIEISDPAAHTKYFCRTDTHVCLLEDYTGPEAASTQPVGAQQDNFGTLTRVDLGRTASAVSTHRHARDADA